MYVVQSLGNNGEITEGLFRLRSSWQSDLAQDSLDFVFFSSRKVELSFDTVSTFPH